MEHIIKIDESEYPVSEEIYNRIKGICDNLCEGLCTKEISELDNSYFYIKDYQRGYRWTEDEVEALLRDIDAIELDDKSGSGYCMQPLVINKMDCFIEDAFKLQLDINGIDVIKNKLGISAYELLDGQQRLTTLWIIIEQLKKKKPDLILPSYNIYYELSRNVDKNYMQNATEVISRWLDKKKENYIISFSEKLTRLFFIWYEVRNSDDGSAERIFRSINRGKIELTNAELVKALLLNPDNANKENESQDAQVILARIAFEWDRIENELRNDDFWYFLSQTDVEKTLLQTRIDYIIEIFARKINKENSYNFDQNKDRFSFLVIQKYLETSNSNEDAIKRIERVWKEIAAVYGKLYTWYCDDELYHTIGFLVAGETPNKGSKAVVSEAVAELFENSKAKSISAFKKEVKQKIYKQLLETDNKRITLDDVKYEYSNTDTVRVDAIQLRRILLFSNIYATQFYSGDSKDGGNDKRTNLLRNRFPFKFYNAPENKCDIEHISARNLKDDIGPNSHIDGNTFKTLISYLKNEISNPEEQDALVAYLNDCKDVALFDKYEKYKTCCEIWTKHAKVVNEIPDNGIENLVLLNYKINRSYGDAFFGEKRRIIIENDKKGVFLPICTRNVFLKYFSDNSTNAEQWTEEDKEAYKTFLSKMFEMIKRWK